MLTLGAMSIAFGLIRILVFKIPESPQYLISKGRDAEAVAAVNYVARFNGKPETLTLAMLHDIDAALGHNDVSEDGRRGLTHKQILTENMRGFKSINIKKLFATRKFAQHTSITWLMWFVIGKLSPRHLASQVLPM